MNPLDPILTFQEVESYPEIQEQQTMDAVSKLEGYH